MHLVDAPILFRTHMHTHWLWVRLERFSVATTSGPSPLSSFLFSLPNSSSLVPRIFHSSSQSRHQESPSPSAHTSLKRREIYTPPESSTRAHRHTHTHTPSQTSRLEDKVLRRALLAEKPNARPDSFFFFLSFFLPIRIRTLMFLSVAHADALNSLAHRAAVPAPLGSETRAPSL